MNNLNDKYGVESPKNQDVADPQSEPPRKLKRKSHIRTSKEFVKTWKLPVFLVDGIFQKGFIYTMTAQTGTGKTALALTLAANIALGLPLAGHEVAQGRVLYFAGENPDDIKTRWLHLSDEMGFDAETVAVDFIEGVFPIDDLINEAAAVAQPYAAVIVDTSAAYFPGEDDNHNVEMQAYAGTLRQLTKIAGKPCVLVATHPAKGRKKEPRGGSAFLNAIDGNVFLDRPAGGPIVTVKTEIKWRGAFVPFVFQLEPFTSKTRKDSKGRPLKSIKAVVLTADPAQSEIEVALLQALHEAPGSTLAQLATAIGEPNPNSSTAISTVRRKLVRMAAARFVEQAKKKWSLTAAGEALFAKTDAKNDNLQPSIRMGGER